MILQRQGLPYEILLVFLMSLFLFELMMKVDCLLLVLLVIHTLLSLLCSLLLSLIGMFCFYRALSSFFLCYCFLLLLLFLFLIHLLLDIDYFELGFWTDFETDSEVEFDFELDFEFEDQTEIVL